MADIDLDETIYDLEHKDAADAYNTGEGSADERPPSGESAVIDGEFDEGAYERLHGDADERAAVVNSGGVHAQVERMVLAWGPEHTRRALDALARELGS